MVTPGLTSEVGQELVHPEQEVEISPSSLEPLVVHIEKPRPTKESETLQVPQGGMAWARDRGQGSRCWARAHFLSGYARGGQAELA